MIQLLVLIVMAIALFKNIKAIQNEKELIIKTEFGGMRYQLLTLLPLLYLVPFALSVVQIFNLFIFIIISIGFYLPGLILTNSAKKKFETMGTDRMYQISRKIDVLFWIGIGGIILTILIPLVFTLLASRMSTPPYMAVETSPEDIAIEISPEDAKAYHNRGVAYFNKGLYDKAITEYNKAIEINPGYGKAYNNRGNAYKMKGLYDQAIADYAKAIEINLEDAEIYNNRGIAYLEKGLYDQAITDFTKALEINPEYAEVYNNRGNAYKKKGLYDQAMADFDKAMEINLAK